MLSDLKLDIVPIPAYVHETWVMTETLLVHSGYTYKGRRGDLCESTAWHFVTKCAAATFEESWMSNHFSEERNPSFVGSAMCPEYPIRLREARFADYTHRKRPRSFPSTRPCDYISNLAVSHLSVEPEELRGIAENHEVFRFLLSCRLATLIRGITDMKLNDLIDQKSHGERGFS